MLDFNVGTPFPPRPERISMKRFGIEVEVENCPTGEIEVNLSNWKTVVDSSLKEMGVEFVSHVLHKDEIMTALTELYSNVPSLKRQQATFGPRTSIHVHSDATWMESLSQLTPLIFMYLLCEDLMYKFVEPHRRKNIFCVKTKETRYLRQVYVSEVLNAECLYKYAGFNLLSLFTHGTVEFRMLEGTYDLNKIYNWIGFIDTIQEYAKTAQLGLSFKREVKNPERARSLIYPAFRDYFNEEEIEKSIQAGLEYFRYLCCTTITPKIYQTFLEDGFFSSKFYTKNYVRLTK